MKKGKAMENGWMGGWMEGCRRQREDNDLLVENKRTAEGRKTRQNKQKR